MLSDSKLGLPKSYLVLVIVITKAAPTYRMLVAGWKLLLKEDTVTNGHNNGN